MTTWHHLMLSVPALPRGVHLITPRIELALAGLPRFRIGMVHLLLQHTSASLILSENAAPEVRTDLERWLSRLAPDGDRQFRHDDEGPDDMPAHAKNAMLGCSLTLPLVDGRLALGTWQGIHLCEHRDQASERSIALTLWGEAA